MQSNGITIKTNNHEIQIVYVKTDKSDLIIRREHFNQNVKSRLMILVKQQTGYFFTPEELEKQKAEWQREAAGNTYILLSAYPPELDDFINTHYQIK